MSCTSFLSIHKNQSTSKGNNSFTQLIDRQSKFARKKTSYLIRVSPLALAACGGSNTESGMYNGGNEVSSIPDDDIDPVVSSKSVSYSNIVLDDVAPVLDPTTGVKSQVASGMQEILGVGDFNNDGFDDLVTFAFTSLSQEPQDGNYRIYLGTENGGFKKISDISDLWSADVKGYWPINIEDQTFLLGTAESWNGTSHEIDIHLLSSEFVA